MVENCSAGKYNVNLKPLIRHLSRLHRVSYMSECLCVVEFIKHVEEKRYNAKLSLFATSLNNSIIQDHEC